MEDAAGHESNDGLIGVDRRVSDDPQAQREAQCRHYEEQEEQPDRGSRPSGG